MTDAPKFYDKATGIECYVDEAVFPVEIRLIADYWDVNPDTAEALARAILDCVKYIRDSKEPDPA